MFRVRHMPKREIQSKLRWGITLLLNVLLIAAVFVLMNYVQHLLYSDVRINLTEIVTQNRDVISSKLTLELNNLDLVATQLSDRFSREGAESPEEMRDSFLAYTAARETAYLSWAHREGQAVLGLGEEFSIAGRKYFRLALEDNPNISERTISRVDGTEIFVMCVPVKRNGKIVGTVQRHFSPQQMYDLCAVSLFSDQGSMYVINGDGYILISSQSDLYSRESDNYYRMLYLTDPEASRLIETDIRAERAGFVETVQNGKKLFSAYTPISEIYDWHLVSSVATNALSPNANTVIRLFYTLLIGVVLFFACMLFYILSQKNRERKRLERAVFVDEVTGGNTYAKFEVELREVLSHARRTPLFFLTFDIDNFKYINSFYGFATGDRILRHIYHLYAAKLGQNECIARVSGDRFVLLLTDASQERLQIFFESECSLEDVTVYLSAGLYPITDLGESVSLMMDKASTAAKHTKGMRYKKIAVYSADTDREMAHNEQTKRAVEQALLHGEIVPFFQPKIDVNTGALVGAEALARWKTADGKLVSPAEFIPVCEKSGLIVAVDMTIFEQTLRFLRSNLDRGVSCVPISVNFSRLHLLNRDFLSQILSLLSTYNVPPTLVELELTESVIFDNYQTIQDFIYTLHQEGLRVSMDDFGSGYSSLHMLKDVEIDVLKIDQGFLRETTDSARQKVIFGAIVQMAQKLDITVVVEGVETTDHVGLMKEFDCVIAQGYFYARPMPMEEFVRLFEEGALC